MSDISKLVGYLENKTWFKAAECCCCSKCEERWEVEASVDGCFTWSSIWTPHYLHHM